MLFESAIAATPPEFYFLLLGGFFIGVFSVVIGGGMFFAIPLMQWLFPQASFGVLVGNIKLGSFFRSMGSTLSTHRQIEYRKNFALSVPAFAGTLVGTSMIAEIDQDWLLPAILLATAIVFTAPYLAQKITNRVFLWASFFTGFYAGIFGAGIGVILIALLRLRHPRDTDIGFVKIQARFVEWLLVITSLLAHFFHDNLVTGIWVPWSAGAIAGGYAGGILLKKMGALSGSVQKKILGFSCGFAIFVALWRLLADSS